MTVFRPAHGAGLPITVGQNQISDTRRSALLTTSPRAWVSSTGTAHRAHCTPGMGHASPRCDVPVWEPK